MNPDGFREWMERRGLNQTSLARLLHELGDPRPVPTILRTIANWARGVTAVPGEMVVITRLLDERANGSTAARANRAAKGTPKGAVSYHRNAAKMAQETV